MIRFNRFLELDVSHRAGVMGYCLTLAPNATSWVVYTSFVRRPRISLTSEGSMCFAASSRNPSTPSEMRSFPYAANLLRTASVSVARLKFKENQMLLNKLREENTYSAKPSSSQVCTSIALLKFLISLFASNPQLWKFYIGSALRLPSEYMIALTS